MSKMHTHVLIHRCPWWHQEACFVGMNVGGLTDGRKRWSRGTDVGARTREDRQTSKVNQSGVYKDDASERDKQWKAKQRRCKHKGIGEGKGIDSETRCVRALYK